MVLDIKFNSFLFDFTETMRYWTERGGHDWPGVRVIYQAWIQIAVPDSDHRDEAESWFGSSEICNRDFCTQWCQGPSHLASQVDFNFTMLPSIQLDIEWCHALSQPSLPRLTKKVCQFYNLRIKFVPDLWADNKLIILSQDLPSSRLKILWFCVITK